MHVKNNKHQTAWRASPRIISIYSLSLFPAVSQITCWRKRERAAIILFLMAMTNTKKIIYCMLVRIANRTNPRQLFAISFFIDNNIIHTVWTTPIQFVSRCIMTTQKNHFVRHRSISRCGSSQYTLFLTYIFPVYGEENIK